ncbi:MAG: DUF6691 family protein [Gammaproteobacteria bacterium]
MIHPRTVLAFLDVTSAWDPTLLFVLGSAVVTAFSVTVLCLHAMPIFTDRFHLPPTRMSMHRFSLVL